MRNVFKKIILFFRDIHSYYVFEKSFAAFRGVYENFEQAAQSIKTKPIGYDNPESVNKYLRGFDKNKKKISETEYPMFFWLGQIFCDAKPEKTLKIFDFGGNLGQHYFHFSNTVFARKKNFDWIVCEVDLIKKVGNELFSNKQLSFTNSFEEADGCDIFFSSGAIQYIPNFSLSISLDCKRCLYIFCCAGSRCKILEIRL